MKISIYPLQSGYYQVSYRHPISGKRTRKRFSSKKEAKLYGQNIERKWLKGELNQFSESLVSELIEQHLERCPDSKLTKRKITFVAFYDHFGHYKLKYLTKVELDSWFIKIKKERDYSDRTLSLVKNQLSHFFRYLEDEGLISSSPLAKIRFKRFVPPKRPRIVMSIDEIQTLLKNAETFSPDKLYPFLATVAHTGARKQEITGLNREDINFETGLIHLKKTKNGRERFIRMSPQLTEILRHHLTTHDQQPVFITKAQGVVGRHCEFERLIVKFRAFFPMKQNNWTLHALRHSFAYNFLKLGGQMYQLQAILGHRSIDVTVDLYGQLQAQDIPCPSPYEDDFQPTQNNQCRTRS